ncbi:MAG: M48 family metallopeptidase [Rhodospirillales bacterium]|nr:M48 family metallopeptidase [Rhodospirillales bacterium]
MAGAPEGRHSNPAPGIRRTDFHAAIRRNERNTVWLCLVMVLIGGAFGYAIGWSAEIVTLDAGRAGPAPLSVMEALTYPSPWGGTGAAIMVIVSALWVMVTLFAGDRILLALAGAREVSAEAEPVLHNVVEEMALASGLPKPRVFVLESPALNAFATGLRPEKSAVAVTRGLLADLKRNELQGVVAHEMSHIANNDILYATAVGVVVGLIALVSDALFRGLRRGAFRSSGRSRSKGGGAAVVLALVVLLVFAILAPLAARLVQMAISREREYLADATAVKFTRDPLGLIGALEKIDGTKQRFQGANRAIQHLFIANPFRKFGARDSALLSTHPPTPARIERLRDLG